jgi:hypothetical protein
MVVDPGKIDILERQMAEPLEGRLHRHLAILHLDQQFLQLFPFHIHLHFLPGNLFALNY